MITPLLMILFTIHTGYSMKGGFSTHLGEFNYIASIKKAGNHYCNGVIINENHIITVAHRIADFPVAEFRVVVGVIEVNAPWAKRHLVQEAFLHPGFERRNFIKENAYYEHDIAVLRLEQSLIWNPSFSQVPLVDREHDLSYYSDCILILWNFPDDRRNPMILKWEMIKFMGNKVHQQWARYLAEYQRFFSDHFGTAAIDVGDLGSPLVCGNSMIALVIEGEQPMIPEKPSIMISIAPYLEFIDDIVHDGLFSAEPAEFPYAASIWYNGTYACGGFIVDAIHVATAGHCVVNYRKSDFVISVGYPAQLFSLADAAIHPNYKVETTDIPPNWYIDHDFALLTLSQPILWNQWTSPLPLVESDNFHVGQSCKILRWKSHEDGGTGELIKLMTSRVIILNQECTQPHLDPSPQSQVPSFWGKSRYLIPIADHRDVGNPIECDGKPVGFLIQAIPFDEKTTAVLARFLKIRPYIELRNNS